MKNPIAVTELKDPVVFVALGFGSGLSPWAPGTAGTLIAIPLYVLISTFDSIIYLAITALVSLIGIWVCAYTCSKLNIHDHPSIVIDEIAGYFITMILAPQGMLWIILGFILFRIFDILKPWPISWIDKNVRGGLGIMLDDVVAGVAALLSLQLIAYTIL